MNYATAFVHPDEQAARSERTYQLYCKPEQKVSDLKDRISRMVQEQDYPDGQAFMAAYNKAESIVKQYEWELAEWKQQVEGKPAEEKKPPERRSVLEKVHRIRDEAQKPQKRSSRDRDER